MIHHTINHTMIFAAIAAGFITAGAIAMTRLYSTVRWMNRSTDTCQRSRRRIWILLPAKNEQRRLPATIAYFQKLLRKHDARIVIITTATEKEIVGQTSTRSIAHGIARTNPHIIHMHYDGTGVMAHQLNFALKTLQIDANDIIGLYNADSRPDSRTFNWIVRQPIKQVQVFQQYGNYTRNLNDLKQAPDSPTLLAAAAWQSRWSMAFEIPHARTAPYFGAKKEEKNIIFMNYCIGHGLFFTKEVYRRVNGFSERTHNEDAIFGLELNIQNIPITPIPYFDSCDTVDSSMGLLRQQKNWYFGPLQANTYRKHILEREGPMNAPKRLRLALLVAQLFSHAIYWIVGPTLFLAMMLYGAAHALTGEWLPLFFAIGAYAVFLPAVNIMALHASKERVDVTLVMKLACGSAMMYLIHGAAAYWAAFLWLRSKLLKTPITKERTPMREDTKTDHKQRKA